MENRQVKDKVSVVCWCLFILYLLSLAYFLFFAEATGRTFSERSYQYNLIPLHEIRRFLIYRRQLGAAAVILNLAGNVLAFVPFGLFLPLLVKRVRSFGKTVLFGFEFSLLVEILQLYSKVGSFDVDDILLNTTGVWIGYLLFYLIKTMHLHNRRDVSDKDR